LASGKSGDVGGEVGSGEEEVEKLVDTVIVSSVHYEFS
jgi:hypothetical protein